MEKRTKILFIIFTAVFVLAIIVSIWNDYVGRINLSASSINTVITGRVTLDSGCNSNIIYQSSENRGYWVIIRKRPEPPAVSWTIVTSNVRVRSDKTFSSPALPPGRYAFEVDSDCPGTQDNQSLKGCASDESVLIALDGTKTTASLTSPVKAILGESFALIKFAISNSVSGTLIPGSTLKYQGTDTSPVTKTLTSGKFSLTTYLSSMPISYTASATNYNSLSGSVTGVKACEVRSKGILLNPQ